MASRRSAALALAVLAAAGAAISIYLTWTKIAGVAPICGPSGGCETVENSTYSSIGGIPVALFGLGYSAVVLATWLAWWRTDRADLLLIPYVFGLIGTIVEAYLVFLELFVIHAVCLWCVAYGVTVVLGWVAAVIVLRQARRSNRQV